MSDTPPVAQVFEELILGGRPMGDGLALNSGDAGLLASLDRLNAREASVSVEGGATIAAHAQHLSYGLGLMNEWRRAGTDPFANARWDDAWKVTVVDDATWEEIRRELHHQAESWLRVLRSETDLSNRDTAMFIASAAHLAYHLGAVRQIHRGTRGPREGTFVKN